MYRQNIPIGAVNWQCRLSGQAVGQQFHFDFCFLIFDI